jgi:hypothetical protein
MWPFDNRRQRSAGAAGKISGPIDDYKREGYTFHYSREARLKKLKTRRYDRKRPRVFSNKKNRSILIVLIDLVLIAVVMYLINKPANVYLQKNENGLIYELNITGIKGKRILIGFSIKNQGAEKLVFSDSVPVVVEIEDRNGGVIVLKDAVQNNTVLFPEESTSVVFLLNQDELPGTGKVDVFTGSASAPVFTKDVRF